MIDFILRYWLECAFGLLCTAGTAAYRHLARKIRTRQAEADAEKAEQQAIKKELIAVLHDMLYRQCVDIIERGEITESELSNINYLYAGYSGLGGNGTGKDLYERAKNQRLIKNK